MSKQFFSFWLKGIELKIYCYYYLDDHEFSDQLPVPQLIS